MEHWEWLEQNNRYDNPKFKCSEHGRHVAQILGMVFGGLHHLDGRALQKANWENETWVEINLWRPQLSTHDFVRLTDLVILCHDACIRLEIDPHTFQTLKLFFHRRDSREGDICRRHPTIEQAIERVRKYAGPKYEDRAKAQHITTPMPGLCSHSPQTGVPASA